MTVKRSAILMAAVFVLFLAFLLLFTILMSNNQWVLNESQVIRHKSYLVADELRESSDLLTRMARTYVLTGDSKYEDMYWHILAVRNGNALRDSDHFMAPGKAIKIKDLMINLNFTEQEFGKMKEAEDNSNSLVTTEIIAMNAVKGNFSDGQGGYTRKGEPDLEMARRIMFDAKYHSDKTDIMSPIGAFEDLLNARTKERVDSRVAVGDFYLEAIVLVVVLLGGWVCLVVWTLVKIVRIMGAEPAVLADIANQVELGNMDIAFRLREDDTNSVYRAMKTMVDAQNESVQAANQLALRNLTVEIPIRSESDVLGKALANMAKNLRGQMGDILEGTNVMAASTNQILTATTQLTSSSVETATAVTQTATTLEEVKQTAIVSAQKAKEVSGGAQQIVTTVQSGQASAQEAADGMTHIQEQMASIAESIVRFGEQSQAIGEIVSAVDDLAEQSNLLAVNAAIEATRAGEEGKGFGVVAEEIKSLAEHSKQATGQVRTILNDIQKATGTAVQAAEQGSKAVETGVDQCMRAGEAIRALNDAVTEAARNAMQIAASSQQQLVGVDQVAGAMVSIKQASTQNATGTQQVETVVHDLDEVGQRLKGLVEMYRVVR